MSTALRCLRVLGSTARRRLRVLGSTVAFANTRARTPPILTAALPLGPLSHVGPFPLEAVSHSGRFPPEAPFPRGPIPTWGLSHLGRADVGWAQVAEREGSSALGCVAALALARMTTNEQNQASRGVAPKPRTNKQTNKQTGCVSKMRRSSELGFALDRAQDTAALGRSRSCWSAPRPILAYVFRAAAPARRDRRDPALLRDARLRPPQAARGARARTRNARARANVCVRPRVRASARACMRACPRPCECACARVASDRVRARARAPGGAARDIRPLLRRGARAADRCGRPRAPLGPLSHLVPSHWQIGAAALGPRPPLSSKPPAPRCPSAGLPPARGRRRAGEGPALERLLAFATQASLNRSR